MSLKEDIKAYTDADGLVAPRLVNPGETNASGNGVLYLGEYMAILSRIGELTMSDKIKFHDIITSCMPVSRGLLHRSPTHEGQEGPDDYVGLLVGCAITKNVQIAQWVIDFGWKHYGFFNNEVPGTFKRKDGSFNWSAFLVRQPQLIALAYWAAGRQPILPLRIYTAFSIALAGRGKPVGDTDSRTLAWMLCQVAASKSWICSIAAKIFEKRLKKDYPVSGMKGASQIYFGADHPFSKYWPEV